MGRENTPFERKQRAEECSQEVARPRASENNAFLSLSSSAHHQPLFLFQLCWSVHGRLAKKSSRNWPPAKPAGGKRGKEGLPAPPPPSAPAVTGSGGFLRGSTLELLSPDLSFCPPPALREWREHFPPLWEDRGGRLDTKLPPPCSPRLALF